ncbi:MAG: ParA family protein [Symploca sp. SIO2E9]|nr:ParA family protein [Symploca sp. SIO2E9]
MTAHVIAIFNAKGGVGKTTTACSLGAGLKKFYAKKVLIVDVDPQGHTGISFNLKIFDLEKRVDGILLKRISAEEAITQTDQGIDVIPSNLFLADAELQITAMPGREVLLRKAIGKIKEKYDFILFDCPPNVGILSLNALMASKYVIAPVDTKFYGLTALPVINRMLGLVRDDLDHPIELLGVLATRHDARTNLCIQSLSELKKAREFRLFETVIPEATKIGEAPSFKLSVFEHAPKDKGAKAYKQFVEEVMSRVK